jgi:hypothetical protein
MHAKKGDGPEAGHIQYWSVLAANTRVRLVAMWYFWQSPLPILDGLVGCCGENY